MVRALYVAIIYIVIFCISCEDSKRVDKIATSKQPLDINAAKKKTFIEFCGQKIAVNTKMVNCNNQTVGDLELLENLKQLEKLYITSDDIVDLSPIAALESLKDIYLRSNNIKNVNILNGNLTRFLNGHSLSCYLSGETGFLNIHKCPFYYLIKSGYYQKGCQVPVKFIRKSNISNSRRSKTQKYRWSKEFKKPHTT